MNVDELMALERDLTPEEFAFLERELLKTTRELHDAVQAMAAQVRDKDEAMADKLEVQAEMLLANVEAAASIQLP